ncbi:MAG: dihydrolipoyllysine-residue acetyltransferase [Gammaproteobacteria bacterium]
MANIIDVRVPDVGDFTDVDVIEVLVQAGDRVNVDDPLITLESDKASMDVPSPHAGQVKAVQVNPGSKVAQGTLILTLEVDEPAAEPAGAAAREPAPPQEGQVQEREPPHEPTSAAADAGVEVTATIPEDRGAATSSEAVALPPTPRPREAPTAGLIDEGQAMAPRPHASPSIRRFARELGVDLTRVIGTGRKGRILREDVQRFVKESLTASAAPAAAPGFALPPMPVIDFSQFGTIEVRPVSRIKRLTGANVHRSWLHVPHVTQHDEADISELEAFRKSLRAEAEARGTRLTLLAFLLKATVASLRAHPTFNASLDASRENLILKQYYHIGVAVDTTEGLVVPVVRDVDKKSIFELAGELMEISGRARERKLAPADLQGGTFTLSSLGGIAGTAFTPIVNAPEVAILGISRAQMKPIYQDGQFVPRLMLPLSLSYDHRVIDGAGAARFTHHLSALLTDIRRLLL